MARTNPAFMSGVPELLVLRLLDREAMYGYQLVRAIRVVSGDTFSLAEGVVYPVLHGLEARGLVKARDLAVEGRTRIYYSLTAKGKRRLAELGTEWARVRAGIDKVMSDAVTSGGEHG